MTSPPTEVEAAGNRRLRDYCDYVLGSLTRADQRRWGEIYIRGLLQADGRRSIRRIASEIGGGSSDQSLQQFINQSPWDPQPVRQRVASTIDSLRPTAWVLDEVAFIKRGRHSAGIERQYVPSKGRLSNCQVGAVAMLVGQHAQVPVNWRLVIPPSWDTDTARRARAHIPAEERHQPNWRYQVQMLDDLSGDWGVPLAPVVVDARNCKSVYLLVGELASRGLDHLVDVTGEATTRSRPAVRRSSGSVRGARNQAPGGTFAELAQQVSPADRTTVTWQTPNGGMVRSQFAGLPVWVSPPSQMARLGGPLAEVARVLVIEWALGGHTPRGCWLTNMTDRSVTELAEIAKLHPHARHELDTLTDSLGLGHHEGRSFLGWHHHVTLVSAARAFQVLNELRPDDDVGSSAPVGSRHRVDTPWFAPSVVRANQPQIMRHR